MFRKGGSAGEGITSGLRQGYNTNENNTVKQNDLSKVDLRNMDMQQIKDLADRMAFQAPPMAPDRSLSDFKIDLGSYGVSDLLEITIVEVDGLNPKVYPNPASPQSILIFRNDNQELATINVYDRAGRKASQTITTRSSAIQLHMLLLESPGLYFFTVEIKGVLRRGKFLFL